MRWFGFGFNGFGQIVAHERDRSDAADEVRVICPEEVTTTGINRKCHKELSGIHQIRTSWSTRLSLHLADDSGNSGVVLDGFGGLGSKCCRYVEQSHGCKDAFNNESLLALAFEDRIEVWDLQKKENDPVWRMDRKPSPDNSDSSMKLPLLSEGYIALKPPFFRPLLPHLKAKSLSLGPEHAILLSTTGAVYTWGQGSHGQLGHGSLTSEGEPRAVEALWGVPMKAVAAGGWHCCCISETADLYVWGWNESGQIGLPSRGVRKAQEQNICAKAEQCQDATVLDALPQEEEVFISIQAFPALLDLNPQSEVKSVSCGSRHTAAVTSESSLCNANTILNTVLFYFC